VLFAVLSFLASTLLAPRLGTNEKRQPYESGIVPGKAPPRRFPVRFSLVAMIFIVFDVEIIFLYPYAMVHRELGLFGLLAVAIFSASVFESFLYLLSKGALDWGPVRRVERPAQMVDPQRTSMTTVRRVGLEGRHDPEETRIMIEEGLLIDDDYQAHEPAGPAHGAEAASSGAH
jgi:NADH-quinone oxidoreductase subunit A